VSDDKAGLSAPLPDATWRKAFRRRLLHWFRSHARDLPWRRTTDPYAIWLSEIMLQQTRVATVEAYYRRFLEALPTIDALARADEHEVLRLWEGLGYYRRAQHLCQAAQTLVRHHGGKFPEDIAQVRRLPGIGRYTAAAILSIAFGQRQAILEANTSRLFCRLLAFRGDPASATARRLLWAMAEAILPRRNPGRLNQAMMELGSEVCLARAPQCASCPVAGLCRARIQGLQTAIPSPRQKQPPTPRHEAAVIVRRRGRVLLVRCPPGGRWARLWDFPRFEVRSRRPAALRHELAEKLRKRTGLAVALGQCLKTLRHSVTRFRITLDCYEAEVVSAADRKPSATEIKWLRPAELEDYPLNATGRKLARLAV
jgi:A/G-specific adenine glycosylase